MRAGDVEDAVDVLHRAANGAAVGDVAGDALVLEVGEVLRSVRAGDEQPKLVAARGERADRCEPMKPVPR